MSQIQVPKGWEVKNLENTCTLVSGNGFPRDYQKVVSKGIPFIKVSDMNSIGNEKYIVEYSFFVNEEIRNKIKAKKYPKNTIIFPKIGGAILTNKKRILSKDSCFDNNIMGLIPDEELDPLFLYYFMLNTDLKHFVKNGPIPSIDTSKIKQADILIPPLIIQKKIVQKLDHILGQLEEKKINIYKILNIQKKRIVNISNNFEIFLFNEIINKKQKYQKKLWKSVKLSEITFKITKGIFDLSPSNYSTHGIPFLRISDIQRNEINFSNVKFIPESIHKKHIRTSIGADDLVLAKVGASAGSPEKIAIIPKNIVQVNLSQNLIGISINKKIISSEYLLNYLKFKLMDQIIAGSKTTTFKSIGLAVLRNVSINLPPLNVQNELLKEFNDKKRLVSANQIETLIEKNESIKKYLIKLQNSVLDKAFSGKLVN